MKQSIAFINAIALCVLAGCSSPAPEPGTQAATPAAGDSPEISSPEPPKSGLSALLDTSNIGRRLDIVERAIGAPEDGGADWSTYLVDGCRVRVESADNVVTFVTILVTQEGCRVPLEPLLGTERHVGPNEPLTFGEFDALARSHTFYTHPCSGLDCGNAMDPYVTVVSPGAHVNNFIDVTADSTIDFWGEHYSNWKQAISGQVGDAIWELDLECDRRFDSLSRQMLATATVESIGFGRRSDGERCQ